MEGLLSTGPTPSSFFKAKKIIIFLNNKNVKKKRLICHVTGDM